MSPSILPEELKRLPGLYRRWELPEVMATHRSYHIEEAGCHADGTPLLALFGDFDSTNITAERAVANTKSLTERDLAQRWRMSPRSLQRWRYCKSGPAFFRVGNRQVRYFLDDVEAYERSRREGIGLFIPGSAGARP